MSKNNNEVLIKVDQVSKKFSRNLKKSLWYGLQDIFKGFLGIKSNRTQLRKTEFWAVKDISFELKRGECLGLIGRNGAGKSTLLKILNGLIQPDLGTIEMNGKVAALIELGAGFNPILTGRENIYINGAVLGFTKREMDDLLGDIIEFSELKDFIDTPVQYYSSGMKVRLGFAVAVNLKPDILILDEVLAVGDAGFKVKSFNKITEMIQNAAVIFVSHSMPNISRISNKILLMVGGKGMYQGYDIGEGVQQYFNLFSSEKSSIEYNEGALIHNVSITNSTNNTIKYNEKFIFQIELEVIDDNVDEFDIMLQITDKDLKIVAQLYSGFTNQIYKKEFGKQVVGVNVNRNCLTNGDYSLTVFLIEKNKLNNVGNYLCLYRNILTFQVVGLPFSISAPVHLE